MALSRDDAERLHRLQRQLEMQSRMETERMLYRLHRDIVEFERSLGPLRQRFIDAMVDGRMDAADKLERQLRDRVTEWLQGDFADRERDVIQRAIRQSATRGAQAVDLAAAMARVQARSLDPLLDVLGGSGASGARYGVISEAVQRQIERKVYQDGLNLSRRLHVRLRQRQAEFRHILAQGMRDGRNAIDLAKRIQRLDVTDARLPKYLRDLDRVLRGTKDGRLADQIRKAAAEAAKRKKGPLGMQGPAKRVVLAARTGSARRMEEAIDYFLQRKVRYHSLVITRTESNNAFRAGHVERAKEAEYVIGIKWNLSASHSRRCECDVLAEQDLYGLGPGVYPPDELPERPHPMCMCYFTDVISLEALRQAA